MAIIRKKMTFWACFLMLFFPVLSWSTILEEWDKIKVPAVPKLNQVKVPVQTTAFLILDIQKQSCNMQRRPRCVDSVPKIKEMLSKARGSGMMVVYSLTSTGKPEDIIQEVAPLPGEPIIQSGVDKFYKTELEKLLKEKQVETVIIAGTAAHGAVLHTAVAAAVRNFKVVIPVDGMSAEEPYAEQYTAWHLLNSPGSRGRVTLTRFDMINF